MRISKLSLGLAGVAALFCSVATATPISGFGLPTSSPYLTGGVVQTFDSTPFGTYGSLTLGNVTYSANSGFQLDGAYINFFNNYGVASIYNGPYGASENNSDLWRFNFGTTVSAFAFNWGASDFTWTLKAYSAGNSLLGSLVISPTYGSNAGEYFGVAAAGIQYATLSTTGPGDWTFVDNFTTPGGQTQVPDSGSTLVLLGTALLAVGGLRRKMTA